MRALFPLLLILALAVPAGADHCTTWTTTDPDVDAAGLFYVDRDVCQPCSDTYWVYEESNGIEGLQRADEIYDNTCHGMIEGDTVAF